MSKTQSSNQTCNIRSSKHAPVFSKCHSHAKLSTLQLAIGDQRAAEGDTSDVRAQIGHRLEHAGGRVSIEVGELDHVLRHAGENCRQAHKAMERRHQLRQIGDFDPLGDGQTCTQVERFQ